MISSIIFVHVPERLPADNPWFLLGFVFVVFVLAERVHRLFEKPAQDYLRERLSEPELSRMRVSAARGS